ncbi:hypothetical protein GGR50DRAFT_35181 [Xylaria sp. CBS 124048]|nr:hypothetical protein GGR50DRAFT_35181 [Xylaria sp. CBS 124048]
MYTQLCRAVVLFVGEAILLSYYSEHLPIWRDNYPEPWNPWLFCYGATCLTCLGTVKGASSVGMRVTLIQLQTLTLRTSEIMFMCKCHERP